MADADIDGAGATPPLAPREDADELDMEYDLAATAGRWRGEWRASV
jgi:hypothetical protein